MLEVSERERQLERKFTELSDRIDRETRMLSSTTRIVSHPAYQEAIEMGESAIPLMLRQLRENPKIRWFTALKEITGEDPVPASSQGKTKEMIKCWLDWGESHYYL
ncbi:hypothetical protein [Baaleninema sp.]|uniref:hypothetical protein n=1 Tax=Baaleninema sp. TaxID=3101197 RepID=UPI003CFDDA74